LKIKLYTYSNAREAAFAVAQAAPLRATAIGVRGALLETLAMLDVPLAFPTILRIVVHSCESVLAHAFDKKTLFYQC
jgi:hypothetical protein